ncbi:MAG: choice-of-anchor B family protein [Bacteroidetes bacterium]|nr:choice-of-anchor B family protein [Bacteroidota bacterium]
MNKQIYNDIWGWEDDWGREYVIMGSLDSTYFIEVTFPDKPVLRDVVAGRDDSCIHRDYKTYGHYAYGVADEGHSSLQVFDLAYLPDSVHVVYDSEEYTRRCHNIFIHGDRAYLASNLHPDWGFIPMSVLELGRNPEKPYASTHLSPLVIDGVPQFTHVHDVFVQGDIAYCSNGNGGLYAYLLGDAPNSFQLQGVLGNYPDQGYNHSAWGSADRRYMAMADETHGMKLKMLDIEDLSDIKVLSTFGSHSELGSIPHNPFILGDKCFVSYYHEGLVVFDISNPGQVELAGQYDTYPDNGDTAYAGYEGCWGTYPFFSSGTIAASDMTHGLFLFNTKNWESPRRKVLDKGQVLRATLGGGILTVDFAQAYEGPLRVRLVDMNGKGLGERVLDFRGRHVEIPFWLGLTPGMYLVSLTTNLGGETIKVVVHD